MDERFAKLTLRLDRIEEVVRTCWRESRELRHDVDDLRREVTDLRRDIGELRTDAERRDATRLAPLEARVAELERRGGISKT